MRFLAIASLFAALLAPAAVLAQEKAPGPEELERHLALERQKLELQALQMKLEFEKKARMQEMEYAQAERELELEQRKMEIEARRRHFEGGGKDGGPLGVILLVCFVIHLLAAIWVYTDIRKRNAGSGLWIVLTLFAGLFGAIVYALVRLGDMKEEAEEEQATSSGRGGRKSS